MTLRRTIAVLILTIALAPLALARQHDHGDPSGEKDPYHHMQQMMDQAGETSDPAERRRLMHEHMEAMHEHMKSMHGMMGQPRDGNMEQRMEKMQERMDDMHKMMEQMMEQHQMMMKMQDGMPGGEKGPDKR